MIKKKTILYNREIEYTIRKSRRSRCLRVSVYCDASVVVTAPVFLGEHRIERFLYERGSWILEKLDHFLRIGEVVRLGGGKRDYQKYREEAREFVNKKIQEVNKIYNFSFGRVSIKNHKRRWGSCSQKRNLNFNYKILFLPENLAEYIIAHELCHLQEFNHSRDFWKLVAIAAPDYRERVRELRKRFAIL